MTTTTMMGGRLLLQHPVAPKRVELHKGERNEKVKKFPSTKLELNSFYS